MHFFCYSEDTKVYNLYGYVARKLIISQDVQFVENEAWDVTIKNTVNIVLIVQHDDMKEEMVQTPHISQNIIAPLNSKTL